MKNFETPDSEKRNINAEWAMLKEMAPVGMVQYPEVGATLAEREKQRRRGERILAIVQQMPNRMDDETKRAKLDKIYRTAERAGIKTQLDKNLASWRKHLADGRIGKETFDSGDELTEEELQKVEQLRERVFDLTEMAPGALMQEFPSGNYLFHGSKVPRLEKILATGGLKNGVALKEDDPEIDALSLNTGFEGISWSMNEIDALPGSRGHIAGFLAAPEDVLAGGETQLVIPSRPAPFEVLQMSRGVNPEEFYAVKKQLETWGDGTFAFSEINSVDNNLVHMLTYKENDDFYTSQVYKYVGDLSAEEMRKHYQVDEHGRVIWDDDMYQKGEIPPALPYIQSLIDRGRLSDEQGELANVQQVLDRARDDRQFVRSLIMMGREEAEILNERYNELLDVAQGVRVDPSKMYFVTSHKDLDDWLKVMARTGAEPKGILLYDDDQVLFENFASKFDGNQKELSREIGRVVDVDKNFWREQMGMDPVNMPRSGWFNHVILESEVKHDKVVRMGDDGKVAVVENSISAG